MAIAFGAAGTRLLVSTASTTWNIAYPAGISAGDLLVVHIVTNGGVVSTTPPTGWTAVYNEQTLTNPKGGLWIKVASGSESGTVTFSVASTTGNAMMFRYTGVDTTTPQDATATSVSDATGTDTVSTMPAITTVTANTMLVYCNGANSGTVTMTGPAGSTERVDHGALAGTNAKAGALYDEAVAATGSTGTRTITLSAGRADWGAMMALRPASTGTTASPTGIASAEAIGTITYSGTRTATPTGIASSETIGTATEFTARTYDFEDGTAQGWTATTAGAGTTAINSAAAHDGGYGVSANVPAATVDQAGFTRTLVQPAQRVVIKGWWKVTTEGASASSNVPFARMFNGTTRIADVYRQNQQGAGANVWLRIVKAAGGANYWFIGTGYNMPLNTWVYVVFIWGLDGKPEVYINGTQYISAANAPADWLAAGSIDTAWLGSQEAGNQGAWAIDSVEIDTTGPAATAEFRPLPIVQAETFGTPAAVIPITGSPGGIATAEGFGAVAAILALTASAVGIGSGETFGTPTETATLTATATGITTAESFGTASANVASTASPVGIASAEAFGTASVTNASAVVPTGIGTAEAFGTATNLGTLTASPAGITTLEAFGVPVKTGTIVAAPSGIGTAETFGTTTAQTTFVASPAGIGTSEALGTPTAAATLTASPSGIGTAEIVSNITTTLTLTASPTGVPTGAAFGTPSTGNITVMSPAGIASAEVFGTATVTPALMVAPTGIPSAQVVSNAVVTTTLTASPTGIPTGGAMGTPGITATLTASPAPANTGETFGTTTASVPWTAVPTGIASGYAPGFPVVTYVTRMLPSGIASLEAFGTASVTIGADHSRNLDLSILERPARFVAAVAAFRFAWIDRAARFIAGALESWSVVDRASHWTTARLEGDDMAREILKSAGASEYVGGTITENTGKDLTAATVQISLGSETQPGTWAAPATNDLGPVNVRKVTMLVGAAPNTPKGEYWVWVKVTDTPENITLRFPQKVIVR